MRVCNTCGIEKPVSEYWPDNKAGYSYKRCKACSNAAKRGEGDKPCVRCKRLLPVVEFPDGKKRRRHICDSCLWGETKRCTRCGEVRPNADFYIQANGHFYSYCKICAPGVNKERSLRQQYRLTPDEYQLMLKRQGGCCAVCGKRAKLRIDHDHSCCPGDRTRAYTCGQCLRGLLCDSCNRGLGMFYDSPENLRKAADYLERWLEDRPPLELFSVKEVA